MSRDAAVAEVEAFRARITQVREAIGRVVVGQHEIVEGALTCLLAGSHVLLEGVPGLGKTLLVRTLAEVLGLPFSRVQFTPDLMPADIIGSTVIEEGPGGKPVFEFRKGPVFASVLLADEINRATPKTQSALLEAMQEHAVTVGRATHPIGEPFFVMATQNPLEQEGTYPLPEAQLDRFFYKLEVPFPTREELHTIIERTTTEHSVRLEPLVSREQVLADMALVRRVPVAQPVQDYAVRLLLGTHPGSPDAPELGRRFVATGASPRGAQALLLASKIRALLHGRFAASVEDVKAVARPALRHRVLMNFEGEAEGVRPDQVIDALLRQLPEAKA